MGKNSSLGLVHVYTGNGKGKTTAAIGLAVRALEHGLRVHIIQFLKGGKYMGELGLERRYDKLVIEQFGKGSDDRPRFSDFEPDQDDRSRALAGLKRAGEVDCDVLILDEIHVALQLGHLQWHEVKHFLSERKEMMEIVCTGRGAPKELLAQADYVTEMKGVTHPFNKGIMGRAGIDF